MVFSAIIQQPLQAPSECSDDYEDDEEREYDYIEYAKDEFETLEEATEFDEIDILYALNVKQTLPQTIKVLQKFTQQKERYFIRQVRIETELCPLEQEDLEQLSLLFSHPNIQVERLIIQNCSDEGLVLISQEQSDELNNEGASPLGISNIRRLFETFTTPQRAEKEEEAPSSSPTLNIERLSIGDIVSPEVCTILQDFIRSTKALQFVTFRGDNYNRFTELETRAIQDVVHSSHHVHSIKVYNPCSIKGIDFNRPFKHISVCCDRGSGYRTLQEFAYTIAQSLSGLKHLKVFVSDRRGRCKAFLVACLANMISALPDLEFFAVEETNFFTSVRDYKHPLEEEYSQNLMDAIKVHANLHEVEIDEQIVNDTMRQRMKYYCELHRINAQALLQNEFPVALWPRVLSSLGGQQQLDVFSFLIREKLPGIAAGGRITSSDRSASSRLISSSRSQPQIHINDLADDVAPPRDAKRARTHSY